METSSSDKRLLNCVEIQKVFRFISIYGLPRTIIKVAGRTRIACLRFFFLSTYLKHQKDVSIIGCGQFGFSTISYFISKKYGNRFLECYDVDKNHSETSADFWGYKTVDDVKQLMGNDACKYVFVVSNHFTHTTYAIDALKAGKKVHVEKPISVTRTQFEDLLKTLNETNGTLYAGYNRPYSKAIQKVDSMISDSNLPITLGCFIFGHKIEEDHWYRIPQEGTRICGNVGHWIDLSMHLFNIRGKLPETLNINITQADKSDFDDNLTISYATDFGDIVTITLTSRGEPFEGIRENINIQCGEVMAVIDDFRKMTLQDGLKHKSYKYSPKDVGHKRSVMQVFSENNRNWIEVVYSTLLMLRITDMVRSGEQCVIYDIKQDYEEIQKKIAKTNSTLI